MTKQLRKDLQNLFNKVGSISERENEILKELQEMSADLGMPRWCSWYDCAKQLRGHEEKYTKGGCNTTYEGRAEVLLKEFYKLEGQDEVIRELGQALANAGFWNKVNA